MNVRVCSAVVLWGLLWFIAIASPARGADCDGRYFAPEDARNEFALRRPHSEFAKKLQLAEAGEAVDQRNLAVAYDAGYLVSRCRETAVHWYEKAALAGDAIAKDWIKEHQELVRLHDGSECFGETCFLGTDQGTMRSASFYAGANGHFFAPVTINGVTVQGMVDTGASTIAMSANDARKFGIDSLPGKPGLAGTANGVTVNKFVSLPVVKVGGIELHDVRAAIGITGPMLIGMSFLSRLNVQMGQGHLSLSK